MAVDGIVGARMNTGLNIAGSVHKTEGQCGEEQGEIHMYRQGMRPVQQEIC